MHHLRRQRLWGKIWRKLAKIFRIIKNIFLVILLVTFAAYFVIAGWLYWEFSHIPGVKKDSVLVMDLDGLIKDRPSMDPLSERLLEEVGKTRRAMVDNIRKAARDPRIKGILLDIGYYGMGRTTAYEIREELIRFKKSGKKVFAFMESAGLGTYLLVSVADKIYMPPSGATYFPGLRAEIPFFKDMLDMVGVTPEFVYIGKYKTAPQPLTMDHISDEYREVINNLLDNLYNNYIEKIAEARNVSEETVTTWIDDGIYPAADALKAGVIDEILYESQVDNTIQRELGLLKQPYESEKAEADDTGNKEDEKNEQDKNDEGKEKDKDKPKLNKIHNGQYARVPVNVPQLHRTGKKIAVIYAQGGIVSGKGAPPSSENPMIGSEAMTKLFSTLADDDDIKGIIFRVDSGGGGARASDIIRNAVYETCQKKPVVVSMAGAAASGGYMISAPATSIVAYPLTLTGSIGIFGGKFSVQGLLDLINVNVEVIQRGRHAGIFSGARPWSEDDLALFRKYIQQGYDDFIRNVAEGRGMTVEEVNAVAQGRVWFGEQALEHGLVDKLGGFDTALAVLKEKLNIPEDEDVQLIEYPKMETAWEQLLRRIRQYPMNASLPKQLQRLSAQLEELSQLQNENLFAWFPYRIIVE